jgi:hypothetical protein
MRSTHQLRLPLIAAAFSVAIMWATQGGAATIGSWNFDAEPALTYNTSPAPSVNNQLAGVPVAVPLGMHNTYTFSTSPVARGSIDGQDLIVTNGVGHPGATDQAWRVRGDTGNVYPIGQTFESNPSPPNDNPAVGNGWALAAPQNTQGAEFDFNATGYKNLVFSYDYFCTNQGVRDQQIQYTTDGTTWTAVGATGAGAGGTLGVNVGVNTGGILYNISTPNDFINGITVDFGLLGINAVNNNSKFGVRITSIYDPTSAFAPPNTSYASATVANGAYNNNSGNWRFDNVSLSGTAVPEPATAVLAIIGLCGFIVGKRRRVG